MILNKNFKSFRKGFTIIELLVACAIIATLAATIFVGYDTTKKKARDAKRVDDMATVKKAIEQYKYSNGGAIPAEPAGCKDATGNNKFCDFASAPLTELTSGTSIYLSGLPKDPSGSTTKYYYFVVDGAAVTTNPPGSPPPPPALNLGDAYLAATLEDTATMPVDNYGYTISANGSHCGATEYCIRIPVAL